MSSFVEVFRTYTRSDFLSNTIKMKNFIEFKFKMDHIVEIKWILFLNFKTNETEFYGQGSKVQAWQRWLGLVKTQDKNRPCYEFQFESYTILRLPCAPSKLTSLTNHHRHPKISHKSANHARWVVLTHQVWAKCNSAFVHPTNM